MTRPEPLPPAHAREKRILFVYHRAFSTFIERDWEIIAAAFPHSELFRTAGPREMWRLRKSVAVADLIFCWFGARNAVASALWNRGRKPLVIVAGGYDVAHVPELGYGTFARFPHSTLARRLFAGADRVLAVSRFTAESAIRNAGIPKERIQVIYHGFDPALWPVQDRPRNVDAVTISGDDTLRKGLDLVFGAAARMPERSFQIIGNVSRRARQKIPYPRPANVTFTGPIYGAALKERLAETRVYLQPSRHESFGCAVAEGMLSGCIPVVCRSSALPEVVGASGFYAEEFTVDAVAAALKQAFAAAETMRQAARAWIVETYPLDRYADRLVTSVAELLS